jgi:thiamine biosynthesis protein ThiS
VSDRKLSLIVNGESRIVPSGATITHLLSELGLGEKRIAVAINRDIVPRSSFSVHELAHGDRVEILEAVGGG